MSNDELFTVEARFHQVPFEIEFLRLCGNVWCKTSPRGATKTNSPMAGIHDTIMEWEIVKLDPLDVPPGLRNPRGQS